MNKKDRRTKAMLEAAERRQTEIRVPVDKDADVKIERFDFEDENLPVRDL